MSAGLVTSSAVVMAPREDGFDVVWSVSRLSRGWVEWEAGALTGTAGCDPFGMVPQSGEVLRARVSGLPPATAVRIRSVTEAIEGEPERHESEWKRVRTLDASAPAAHIAVWNDTHQNDETIRALDAATPPVDMLVWNGDLCNDWKQPDAFASTVLNPAGLDVSAGRPLAITVGNHDVRGRWAYRLRDFIATPEGSPYWAGRIGPVAFVVLHTGEDKPDAHPTFEGRVAFDALRAEQAAWLAEITRRPGIADAPFRIVFCHIPLRWTDETPPDYDGEGYDWFSGRSRAAWHDSLVRWGAQLVVSGHTHYPAFLPGDADLPYAQLVSGGPEAAPAAEEAAMWIRIDATEDRMIVTMRSLDGAVVHESAWRPAPGATGV